MGKADNFHYFIYRLSKVHWFFMQELKFLGGPLWLCCITIGEIPWETGSTRCFLMLYVRLDLYSM